MNFLKQVVVGDHFFDEKIGWVELGVTARDVEGFFNETVIADACASNSRLRSVSVRAGWSNSYSVKCWIRVSSSMIIPFSMDIARSISQVSCVSKLV